MGDNGGDGSGGAAGGVNWEFLLNRGLGGGQEGGEEAARARDVDVDCPHSVLGLKLRSSFTHGQLQRAFRKELLLHHPDHRPEAEKAEAVSSQKSVSVSASRLFCYLAALRQLRALVYCVAPGRVRRHDLKAESAR